MASGDTVLQLPDGSGADPRTEESGSDPQPVMTERNDDEDRPDVGVMTHEHCERLRLTRDHIVQKLQAGHVLPRLRREEVISDRDVDEIMHRDNDSKQSASVLLEILPRRGARAFRAFYDSLLMCEAEDYYDLIIKLDRVVVRGVGIMKENDRIQVVIRVRPLRGEEKKQEEGCLTVDTRLMQVSIPTRHGVKQFNFDTVFPEETTQAEIFNKMASPIVDAVLEGYNGCILCYGKSGSGKTYTMAGPSDRDLDEKTEGIIYRALKQLFLKSQEKKDWNIAFFVSVLEIYNEKVFDLTVTEKDPKPLKISQFAATNLTRHSITGASDAIRVFFEASKSRRSRATAANKRSSRSHMIFQVIVNILHKGGTESGRTGALYLVDLAGSEAAGEVNTGAQGRQEGANINLSLMNIREVIKDLSMTKLEEFEFKFRRSTLTMLLKKVLTGNSNTAFIVNVDSSKRSQIDTKRSLEFASDAKKVKVKPTINYIPLEVLLNQYLKHIAGLKRHIQTQAIADQRRRSQRNLGAEVGAPDSESYDLDRIHDLVNFSVTNTVEDVRAKLDGLLKEECQGIKDKFSAQLRGFQAAQKLLEEFCNRQRQMLEHLPDDESGQLNESMQQVNAAMDDLKAFEQTLVGEMMFQFESIRKDMDENRINTCVPCCECCEVCCSGLWYWRPEHTWYSLRGKGAGWVVLLLILHAVTFLLIVLCLESRQGQVSPENEPASGSNNVNLRARFNCCGHAICCACPTAPTSISTNSRTGGTGNQDAPETLGPRDPTLGPRELTPGQRDPTPGLGDPRPGQRDPTPGLGDPRPGQRDPTPGLGDPTPGQRDPTPGQRDPTPGQRDPTPGQRDPTPGQRDPTPGQRDPTPGLGDPTPGLGDPTPGPRNPTPGPRNPILEPRNPTPGPRDPSPAQRDPTPGLRDPTPTLGDPV